MIFAGIIRTSVSIPAVICVSNAYHKYEALADALDRDVQKADTRQAAASLKSELIMLASAASRAKLPSAPEGALLALAKEVIAVGRLYGYDGKGD